MGRRAEGNLIYGRGLLSSSCPDFVKKDLEINQLLFNVPSNPEIADISLLSSEVKHYLKTIEIVKKDKYHTSRENAKELVKYIEINVKPFTCSIEKYKDKLMYCASDLINKLESDLECEEEIIYCMDEVVIVVCNILEESYLTSNLSSCSIEYFGNTVA